jgi:ankyrin repeat protein
VLKGGPAAAGLNSSGHNQHASSSSYSKSPTYHSHGGNSYGSWNSGQIAPAPPSEVNRRDHYGRTALHLIASSDEGISIDFLLALLSHPSCNVNVQDGESGE